MTFKDDIKDDLQEFVELTEFAELIKLDGLILPAQMIHHTAEKSGRQTENYAGLHGDFTELYFMSEPYKLKRERLPRNGEWIFINDKRYDVISVTEELGIAHVVCSAYRQNVLRGHHGYNQS